MQSMVLSRESISSVYAIVIPVRPLFATSSFTQSTGIHSDTVIGTALRRACGASCIRLSGLELLNVLASHFDFVLLLLFFERKCFVITLLVFLLFFLLFQIGIMLKLLLLFQF